MLAKVRNDLGWSQERAAFEAGIGRRTLTRYEIAPQSAQPDKIMRLAEAYNNPEILEWYCTEVCEIGSIYHCKMQVNDLSSAVLTLLKEMNDVQDLQGKLISISCDGKIDKNEIPDMEHIMEEIEQLESALHALKCKAAKFMPLKEKSPVLAHRR